MEEQGKGMTQESQQLVVEKAGEPECQNPKCEEVTETQLQEKAAWRTQPFF